MDTCANGHAWEDIGRSGRDESACPTVKPDLPPWEEYLDLSGLVRYVLRLRGSDVLREPKTLLAFALDYMDHNLPELRVLEHCCEDQLLAPFAAALDGASGIGEATERAKLWLLEECSINEDTATSIARGIARGMDTLLPGAVGRDPYVRELYVFYLLDSGAWPPRYTELVLRATVYVLQEAARKDSHLRVKCAALKYNYLTA